ncbi:jg20139 [Pararge aegeria aegeria]|uniref:Jg20139 protein n=1 Tax=Pararge aegeria aegeria TaxID=348720 RepID=A0A8S4SFR5_9NEOP|nr:jg20139 [Pararge aegeria aegeria]
MHHDTEAGFGSSASVSSLAADTHPTNCVLARSESVRGQWRGRGVLARRGSAAAPRSRASVTSNTLIAPPSP